MPSSSGIKIKDGMDYDDWSNAWLELCSDQGHSLERDRNGYIDTFAEASGFCNGPKCTKCGWSGCMHCDFTGEKIPKCEGEPQC